MTTEKVSKFEPDPVWDIPIELGLKTASALRKYLSIDEQYYIHVAGQSCSNPKEHVLYTALDEVKKTAMYLMRLQEFYQGGTPKDDSDVGNRIIRLAGTQVTEEQEVRIRRLLEVLLTLVLFGTTDEQPYYRHLLILEELEDNVSANADIEEFYGERIRNIDEIIKIQIGLAKKIEKEIDTTRCWYLSRPVNYEKIRPGDIFSSIRFRVKKALPHMNAAEKIAIGFSYAGYIMASESAHFSVNRHDYRKKYLSKRGVYGLGLLILTILNRCHELMGRPDVPQANDIPKMLRESEAARKLHLMTVRDIEIGDFVLAYSDLGEVVDIRESVYGYRSYRVRYIAEKPLPQIEQDWFPPRYVQRLYTRTQLIEEFKKMIDRGELPPEFSQVEDMPAEKLQPVIRKTLLEVWHGGLRDWIRNQQRSESENK